MKPDRSLLQVTRRRFAFWFGFGMFNLAEVLRADSLDTLAAQPARLRAAHLAQDDRRARGRRERDDLLGAPDARPLVRPRSHRRTDGGRASQTSRRGALRLLVHSRRL